MVRGPSRSLLLGVYVLAFVVYALAMGVEAHRKYQWYAVIATTYIQAENLDDAKYLANDHLTSGGKVLAVYRVDAPPNGAVLGPD